MIRQCVVEFVAQQRALGFKYRVQSSLLRNYATFAQERGDTYITVNRVLEWSAEAPSATQKRNRFLTVRRLALSAHADNPLHQIPPADAFGGSTYRRRRPHIYTAEELDMLCQAALCMTPSGSVRPLTFHTLFTLLRVSGLRISEAVSGEQLQIECGKGQLRIRLHARYSTRLLNSVLRVSGSHSWRRSSRWRRPARTLPPRFQARVCSEIPGAVSCFCPISPKAYGCPEYLSGPCPHH